MNIHEVKEKKFLRSKFLFIWTYMLVSQTYVGYPNHHQLLPSWHQMPDFQL